MKARLKRLEREAEIDEAILVEAEDLLITETLKRVSDENLNLMAALIERIPGASGEEVMQALRREEPEVARRWAELYHEVG